MTDGDDVLRTVREAVDDRAAEATGARVTVGPQLVLVDVTHPAHGRLAGVAHRPPGQRPDEWPSSVEALAGLATGDGSTAIQTAPRLGRAVGIAALNALSTPDVDWSSGDPMADLDDGVTTIATVGLFRPALSKFGAADVRVVERDPPSSVDAPEGVTVTTFEPDRCETAFRGAAVCFVTGSTLVYGGLGRYLSALSATGVPGVVLVGATASLRPEPAFEAGVDVLAGARVRDVERVRDRVLAGDCGTDLHGDGLQKCYVARRTGSVA